MPFTHTFNPAYIADKLGINVLTLKRWSATYAQHLSDAANPGPGLIRQYSQRDLDVLTYVRDERSKGTSAIQIADLLGTISFPEIDETPGDLSDDPQPDLPVPDAQPGGLVTTSTATSQGALEQLVQSAVQSEISVLRAEITDMRKDSRSYVSGLAMGFVLALLFILVIIGLALLFGRML